MTWNRNLNKLGYLHFFKYATEKLGAHADDDELSGRVIMISKKLKEINKSV